MLYLARRQAWSSTSSFSLWIEEGGRLSAVRLLPSVLLVPRSVKGTERAREEKSTSAEGNEEGAGERERCLLFRLYAGAFTREGGKKRRKKEEERDRAKPPRQRTQTRPGEREKEKKRRLLLAGKRHEGEKNSKKKKRRKGRPREKYCSHAVGTDRRSRSFRRAAWRGGEREGVFFLRL